MPAADENEMTDSSSNPESAPHILVVDDDAEIVESIKVALTHEGFRVSVARDGNHGLAIAEVKEPDLLILDLMMPKRSGFLVLERLRQESDRAIPVIMMTGNEGSRHRQYAELLGVNVYIQKPFTMDQLIQSVHELLKSSADR